MLVPLRKAIKLTGLSPNTLRKYADDGIIKAQRLGKGKQRLFDVSDLLKARKDGGEEYGKPVVCYCRVSSPKQKDIIYYNTDEEAHNAFEEICQTCKTLGIKLF